MTKLNDYLCVTFGSNEGPYRAAVRFLLWRERKKTNIHRVKCLCRFLE